MNKKTLFAGLSLILTLGLVVLVALPAEQQIPFSFFLSFLSGIFAIIAFREDLRGIEFITLTTLPVLFTFGMANILHFFPNFSLFFRFVFWSLYSFFFYIILLCGNIFNVAAEKSIPLLRASYTASFLVTLFAIFPLYTVIFKKNPSFLTGLFLVSILTFVLTFQSLWTIFLPKMFDVGSIWGAVVVTLILVEASIALSFYPLESFFRALALSTVYYIVLGFAHHYFRKTLSAKVYLEYFLIFFIVALVILL